MSYQNIPSVNEIKRAAAAGQRFTPEDVSSIAQAESELTGGGPVKGGPAATAHSLSSKQMNFDARLDELSHKPPSHITQEDARQLQSAEVRHGKDGSSSDEIRSVTVLGHCSQSKMSADYMHSLFHIMNRDIC
ncbi:conserved hypothetical protein [Talaromyces stipitatus ATCC 10500]|uniref:SMP domain-containing protein n=1 Tax=Talaromyces stipitatus (strain ATCC 10500 / CBS 375.48 / QM 6759 / NRRL 1006) TaxID=441959 RepID=B8MMA6_TALSN|nr:uncharacterized protein TSTA_099140 [Talaromyces stipitatus ATCC 10500]XP_002485899.1 uncharacterized protein TSTA_099140 [Talaromyces stipitatus ATCC 10500]EED13660.1 conserved hypothetical protein [Talaromyces stipitatus ATCC 10500]EED13661.1 conserved hypothetical protein [Talaromyces stipitatus ATCC 10500]